MDSLDRSARLHLSKLMAARDVNPLSERAASVRRPFYYADPAHLSWLREEALAGSVVGTWVWAVLEKAVAYLDVELPTPDWFARVDRDELEIQQVVRLCSRWVHHLAFGYLLTGDVRMAERACLLLRGVCEWPRWTHSRFSWENWTPERLTNYRAQLPTAELSKLVATGYDWLSEWLCDRDKQLLRMVLIEKGVEPIYREWINPETRIHDGAWCNWWAVLSGGGGAAAVILDGDEPTGVWVPAFKSALQEWFTYQGGRPVEWFGYDIHTTHPTFGRDGGYSEGLTYLNYALQYALYFLYALRDRYDDLTISSLPQLQGVKDFWLHTTFGGSRPRVVNFNDGLPRLSDPEVVAGLATLLDDGNLQWYLLNHYRSLDTPHALLAYDPSLVPIEPNPESQSRVYGDLGWALARTGWNATDIFFGFKSGPVFSHGHMDAGSFILAVGDETLLEDAGTCAYGFPEHKEYFITSRAHNTVLINGQGQTSGASLKPVLRSDRYVHVVGNIGDAYAIDDVKTFVRHAVFSPTTGSTFLLDLYDVGEAEVTWLLHPGTSGFHHDESELVISGEQGSLKAHVAYPDKVEWTVESGYTGTRPVPQDFLSLALSENVQTFLLAIAPWASGGHEPTIKALRHGAYVGASIESDIGTEYFLTYRDRLARRSSVQRDFGIWHLATDAQQVYLHETRGEGTFSTLAMIEGTHCSAMGVTMTADIPVSVSVSRLSSGCLSVTISAETETRVEFQVADVGLLSATRVPHEISVDEDLGRIGFVIPAGSHSFEIAPRSPA